MLNSSKVGRRRGKRRKTAYREKRLLSQKREKVLTFRIRKRSFRGGGTYLTFSKKERGKEFVGPEFLIKKEIREGETTWKKRKECVAEGGKDPPSQEEEGFIICWTLGKW